MQQHQFEFHCIITVSYGRCGYSLACKAPVIYRPVFLLIFIACVSLARMEALLIDIGVTDLVDIIYVSTHDELLEHIKKSSKLLDYYRFLECAKDLKIGYVQDLSDATNDNNITQPPTTTSNNGLHSNCCINDLFEGFESYLSNLMLWVQDKI